MKSFFSSLVRELKGYFAFPLAYVLLIAFVAVSVAHLEPSVSPFSNLFGNERGWLARLIPPDAWHGWGQVAFGLAAYSLCILPGAFLFLLVLARCFDEDDTNPEEIRATDETRGEVVGGQILGTTIIALFLWLPAVAYSWQIKALQSYNMQSVGTEIAVLALVAGLARGLWTRGFRTLFYREVLASFYSPIAYVVICFILIATGFDFFSGVSFLNQAPTEVTVIEASFNTVLFWIPTLIIAPLITMRTYADEFRMGTFEMVSTAPVRDWEVVAAKFCGALFFYSILWLPSALYFVVFQILTGKSAALAAGAYGGAYLMIFLIGMLYISIGCLCSSLTREQINALVMSFVVIFGVFAMGLIGMIMNIGDRDIRTIISYFSTVEHMGDFSRGLIDTRPIVFYLSMTGLMLFLNYHVFQFRKWKA